MQFYPTTLFRIDINSINNLRVTKMYVCLQCQNETLTIKTLNKMENIKINQEDVTTLIYLIENKIENLEGLIESLEKRKMVPGVVEINKETVLNLTRILNNLKK